MASGASARDLQDRAICSAGQIRHPDPVNAGGGRQGEVADAARRLGYPVIPKHNRAGKGLGVRLFPEVCSPRRTCRRREFENSVDGITLFQRYIRAPAPYITRVEFVGGKFVYAVRVDTSQGFELVLPSLPGRRRLLSCGREHCDRRHLLRFQRRRASGSCANFAHPIVKQYQQFLAANDIGVAGIEFITDAAGLVCPCRRRQYQHELQ